MGLEGRTMHRRRRRERSSISPRRRLVRIGEAIFAWHTIAWLFASAFFISPFGGGMIPRNWNLGFLPYTDCAVADSGEVAIFSKPFGRVQVYTSEGKFRAGWPLGAGGGGTYIWINPGENAVQASVDSDAKHYTFDLDGNILNARSLRGEGKTPLLRPPENANRVDRLGNRYEASGFFVLKTSVDGTKRRLAGGWLAFILAPATIILSAAILFALHAIDRRMAKLEAMPQAAHGVTATSASGRTSAGQMS